MKNNKKVRRGNNVLFAGFISGSFSCNVNFVSFSYFVEAEILPSDKYTIYLVIKMNDSLWHMFNFKGYKNNLMELNPHDK